MKTKDWILLSLVLIGFEILLYVCTTFGFTIVMNVLLILFIIKVIEQVNTHLGNMKRREDEEKQYKIKKLEEQLEKLKK